MISIKIPLTYRIELDAVSNDEYQKVIDQIADQKTVVARDITVAARIFLFDDINYR